MKACPAGLYKQDDAGNIHFDSAGCLECGTCRVLCGNTILEQWQYPAGTFGIDFATANHDPTGPHLGPDVLFRESK